MFFRVLLATLVALLPAFGSLRAEPVGFERSTLVVVTTDGRRHPFAVELATSEAQLMQGLMFRTALAADAGMLFDFGRTRPVAMWMKNTLIPLDMLFAAPDGRVVHVEENAAPGSLEPRGPTQPVLGVLELAGGTARRLGLRPGDRIEHPMFSGRPPNSVLR